VAIAIAVLLAPGSSAIGIDFLRIVRWAGIAIGAAAIGAGTGLLAARRASIRERGWELEALGTAALGLGWLAGLATTAGGGPGT